MTTELKKTAMKEVPQVTSGRDFVAAKPAEVKPAEQDAPKPIGPTPEEEAAHKASLAKLEAEFKERAARLEAEEAAAIAAARDRIAKSVDAFKAEATAARENVRGKPIPVEAEERSVRHISEIDPSYNGKEDTIYEL